jgi:hypothetical protein
VNVQDNDGSAQSATKKCSLVPLTPGLHTLYIEGWSDSETLSMAATYSGPDTLNATASFQAVSSPLAPSSAAPVFDECNAEEILIGENNFTICAFKANNDIDLQRVDDVYAYYKQVGGKL